MRTKKFIAILLTLSMMLGICSIGIADPSEDFHSGPLPGETEAGQGVGPEVVEYYEYKEDKKYEPGSLLGDVDLSTVGRGLFYDGTDFYYFIDVGTMANNFMYTIEGDRFFFGENGKMVKDELVSYNDELYYFDINGVMYKNRWYTDEQIDESDNTIHYTDYYFGPTGRAYRASSNGSGLIVKMIDGERYGFNVDGEKLEGYYDQNGVEQDPEQVPAYEDCVYYFDPEENGAAAKGWHYYEGNVRGDEYDDNEELVLYFDDKTCRKVAAKVTATDTGRAVSRIIDGQRYMFDSNGIRKNSWYSNEPGRASQSNLKYFNEEYDGYLQKGWFTAVPGAYGKNGDDLQLEVNKLRHKNDEERWFYALSNGNILKKTIRKIGTYIYAFDDDGVMQEAAFVKVKNGSFIKAYEVDNLTRSNILMDPGETGGNADPDPDGVGNPINLDKNKGILRTKDGEQWMYFQGEENGSAQLGAQCKKNVQEKVELNDADIFFMSNTTGGYSNWDADVNITTVVQRGGKYIQNGVVLRPDPDDGNYGIIRLYPKKDNSFNGVRVLNYKNERIEIGVDTAETEFFRFQVVDAKGSIVKGVNKSIKDKNGEYLYIGYNGDFLGYYPYEGKYFTSAPKNLVDENGDKMEWTGPCWAHKVPDEKNWVFGMPDEDMRVNPSTLYLNFNATSTLGTAAGEYGPYNDGLASIIYTERQ